MANLMQNIRRVAVLGITGGLGYIVGRNSISDSGYGWTNSIKCLLGLSLENNVSAAVYQGSTLQVVPVPEIVPEPARNSERIAQIMRFGFPSFSNIRSMDDYVISYDTRTRVPYWVFEHLTVDSVKRNQEVDRSKCDFQEDLSIYEFFRSRNSDYLGSGFDRGHMAAAGNHRKCQKHCQETFLLSNIAPQVGKGFNRDKWNELEQYCRKLVHHYRNVYVCTGPLYLPRCEDDGKMYVRYQVIGLNHVAVPTHFFKIVICEDESHHLEEQTFLLPNEQIHDSVPLSKFLVPREVVERAAGMRFFEKINPATVRKINGVKQPVFLS